MYHLRRSLVALIMMIGGSIYLGAGIDPADSKHIIGGIVFLVFGLFFLAARFEETYGDGVQQGEETAVSAFRDSAR